MSSTSRIHTAILSCLAIVAGQLHAQQPVSLMTPKESWTFNNGAEFPGATGSLKLDPDAKPGGVTFQLVGDFTKGGRYVQMGRKLDKIEPRELAFWVKNPDAARLTMRLTDASGQTHQIALKLDASEDWQRVVFPLEKFFTSRGTADAVTNVAKYESWGGAKDGRWHGPATGLYLLLSHSLEKKEVRRIWIHDLTVVPRPVAVPGAEVATMLRLDDIVEGEHDWRFSRGDEFKGAKGSLEVVKNEPAAGQSCLKLTGDFSGGGVYVAAIKDLTSLGVKEVTAFHLRIKTETGASLRVQLKDATGQTHQRQRTTIAADGKWQTLTIKPTAVAGGEHWGGANDGKWHGPPQLIVLSVGATAGTKQPVLHISEVRAEALVPVFRQPAAFRADFENADKLDAGWTSEETATIDGKTGSRSLLLTRSLEKIESPCSAVSPTFPAAPGKWDIGVTCKADLNSPDNSYHGIVHLECLDDAGKLVERFTLAEQFGKRDWQPFKKSLDLPKGTASGRFRVHIQKAHGQFWVDNLSAEFLAPATPKDERIARLLFGTSRIGNLFLPDDPLRVEITVEAIKPLRESQLSLSYVVRDYWGDELIKVSGRPLVRGERKGERIVYQTEINLSRAAPQVGRYYELHASIPQQDMEPFRNFTSFAILPEAVTKKHKPEEVPFTSRNWDNRIPAYFELSDRLGLRTCGVWGGWSPKPPYKAEAPNIDLCTKFGMGVLSGTPISSIERGKTDHDENSLRQGIRNWIEKYGKYRPLTINLGNEPHGKGEVVLRNVAAYRTVYEEIKKVDPSIFVLATAVEPNEEYFAAGYGKWCDAFDFHVYEGFKNVRRNIEQYKALMKKHGVEKPIWSTELGLNSQGMTRHVVAVEVVKTLTTFFAAGGKNASWFGVLYPDADAKSYGSSGDSHNIFDCRYNRYAPRLDAIAYYHVVNGIAVKKFVEKKTYPEDIHAILFRDSANRNLMALWKAKGRQDVMLPLNGVKEVRLTRVDGRRSDLDAAGRGVTLSVGDDPLLLEYDGGEPKLPEKLDAPAATLIGPDVSPRRRPLTLTVHKAEAGRVFILAPTSWSREREALSDKDGDRVRFTFGLPEGYANREAEIIVPLARYDNSVMGELYSRVKFSD